MVKTIWSCARDEGLKMKAEKIIRTFKPPKLKPVESA
jgi:hypothetical protein